MSYSLLVALGVGAFGLISLSRTHSKVSRLATGTVCIIVMAVLAFVRPF